MPHHANDLPPEPTTPLAHYSPEARQNALILVLGFAVIILIGTLLLRLPMAGAERPLDWEEAFFTATSATTVTGLVVVTTATDLSLFGQLVVLLLIEIGGVGFVAFSVLLFALIGRRVGLAERILVRQTLGVIATGNIVRFTAIVLAATLTIQLAGAMLLWLRWAPSLGPARGAYLALFHAVSAFCNAGFDLYTGAGDTLFGFDGDPYTLFVLIVMIILGGLGIVVGIDLVTYRWDRRLMVHTRLTLVVTAILYLFGLAIVPADPLFGGAAFAGMPADERLLKSLFTVVSARTAGLTIIPLEQLDDATALALMVSMFVGGAPASMAGGVTMSTLAVLAVAVHSTVRGLPHAVAFGRMLPLETIAKAVAIMTVSSLLCLAITLALVAIMPDGAFRIMFEVVSAFSNTGYSLGATTELSTPGRILIAFTMFWGRLGPLTLVVMLAQRERPSFARYPAEQIVIG